VVVRIHSTAPNFSYLIFVIVQQFNLAEPDAEEYDAQPMAFEKIALITKFAETKGAVQCK
jgi:hypothetical protein